MAVFVRRRGRFTQGQKRALEQFSERYLVAPTTLQQLSSNTPVGVEIGFGMGHALLEWAAERPDWQFIGVDVYLPGIGAVISRLESNGMNNVQLIDADAQWLVCEVMPEQCVQEFRILFPDPWPKKRHAKRRLVQAEFVQHLARCLVTGGVLRLATDWQPYAEAMLAVLDAEPTLLNVAGSGSYSGDVAARPATRFEDRGRRLGHEIWDLTFERLPRIPRDD